MGKPKQANKKTQTAHKWNKSILISCGAVLLIVLGFIAFKPDPGEKSNPAAANTGAASGELKILKSEVTSTAKFYPYKAGNTYMEVMAVKANDGTIRTALNTCQVCFDSGRGYYKQQGDVLVCQNCGNRFRLDQVEKIKGGCNPVPILEENKTDDGTNIVIAEAFMEENKDLFIKWRK